MLGELPRPSLRSIKYHWLIQGPFFRTLQRLPSWKHDSICVNKKPDILIYHLGCRTQQVFLPILGTSKPPQDAKSKGTSKSTIKKERKTLFQRHNNCDMHCSQRSSIQFAEPRSNSSFWREFFVSLLEQDRNHKQCWTWNYPGKWLGDTGENKHLELRDTSKNYKIIECFELEGTKVI